MVDALVELRGIRKVYPVHDGRSRRRAHLRAVDGVDLEVVAGTSIGIVGESGCGKTTLARLLLLLEQPTAGAILFDGVDMASQGSRGRRRYRAAVQPVFQDPYSSLSPRLRVGSIVGEPLHALAGLRGQELDDRVHQALTDVGLGSDAATRYPYQFSGGQRQRIALARALALRPRLIVLDEPVSALDVSIRAQMLNLLKDLEEDLGLTFVLIAHDLPTLRFLVGEVVVMYLGRIVERGPTERIFEAPAHPYTRALLNAIPAVEPSSRAWIDSPQLEGELPNAIHPPSGCSFRTRCPHAEPVCAEVEPTLEASADGWVACHLAARVVTSP